MYRFVLVLALIPALCSFINAQSQEPSPDPVELNDPVGSEPLAVTGPDDPAVAFRSRGIATISSAPEPGR